MKNNYKNSALARFHKDLASKRQWGIDQLAEAIQVVAFEAQKVAGEEHPQRAGDDYVKAMLYGRRAMPHTWRVATATALRMEFAEYEQKRALIDSQRPISTGTQVLPIDFWPHLTWHSNVISDRKIAARLYVLERNGFTPAFSVVPGQWQAPSGFSNYPTLRNEAWQEFAGNFVRMKKEPPNPKPVWHVNRLILGQRSEIKLEVMQSDYRDILVTGSYQGLNHQIEIDSGQKCTVRDWLASHWKPGDSSEPVLPGARHLVVNLMVLTNDGFAVLSRQGPDNPDSTGDWCTSTGTVVNPKRDTDSRQVPDLFRAASRGCKEELGMETDAISVRWLSVAAGLKYGSITVFGVLESPWSRQQIQKSVALNVSKAKRNSTRVCEVVEVEFLEVTEKAIANRLKTHDYRPYLELGLALLLWERESAQFIKGVAEH